MKKTLTIILAAISLLACRNESTFTSKDPVDYVSTLVGTLSKHSLSTGNTYPAMALPWGMNFWTPQTGPMGDGWTYVYTHDKIRGFKHQRLRPVLHHACLEAGLRSASESQLVLA